MDGPCDYGHFDIVLADFLKKNSISKNQLSEKANLQRTQPVSYTHLTLPTIATPCRSRWSPYH